MRCVLCSNSPGVIICAEPHHDQNLNKQARPKRQDPELLSGRLQPAAGFVGRRYGVAAQEVKVLGEGGAVTNERVRLERTAEPCKELLAYRVQSQ